MEVLVLQAGQPQPVPSRRYRVGKGLPLIIFSYFHLHNWSSCQVPKVPWSPGAVADPANMSESFKRKLAGMTTSGSSGERLVSCRSHRLDAVFVRFFGKSEKVEFAAVLEKHLVRRIAAFQVLLFMHLQDPWRDGDEGTHAARFLPARIRTEAARAHAESQVSSPIVFVLKLTHRRHHSG